MPDIRLSVEESYSLLVDELASGGYSWSYSVDQSEEVVNVSERSRVIPQIGQPGGQMPGNYEGKREFIVNAIRPGNAVVSFFLRRQWEQNKPPLKEQQLNIEVVAK
jgi:predicted secreted protein